MKNLFLIIALVLSVTAIAQEESKKLTRKEKQVLLKAERAKTDSIAIALTRVIIENKQFVLEADRLQDRRGNSVFVMSNINFIGVDSTTAVFQFGSAHTVGVNGLGGATVEGKLRSYTMKENKKRGSYYIQMTISAPLGIFDISLSVGAKGSASATVTAMRGGKLHYSGKLVPLQTSTVFKGRSL